MTVPYQADARCTHSTVDSRRLRNSTIKNIDPPPTESTTCLPPTLALGLPIWHGDVASEFPSSQHLILLITEGFPRAQRGARHLMMQYDGQY